MIRLSFGLLAKSYGDNNKKYYKLKKIDKLSNCIVI
jgi:hypothetical protein